MVDFSKLCTCRRRKLFWLLLYFLIFAFLCWAIIRVFLQHEENIIEIDAKLHNDTTQSKQSSEITTPSVDSIENHYYTAAVIDFTVSRFVDVLTDVKINLQNIVNLIAECAKLAVDIVVFPEGGIYGFAPIGRYNALLASTYVPAADDFIIPCQHKDYDEKTLHYLSCAAKENKIYVAVNLIEKVRSPKSSYWDGLLLYNTAVVFDRNGMVIARYRKFHLYTERWFQEISAPDSPEYVTFTTDFGVKFGVLVCADIGFVEPGVELARKHNITHFLHLSQMISTLPFLGAASIDFGWSYSLDVVVLSSTIPHPENTLGTNIYFGRRLGTHTYIKPFKNSKIILAPIPKNRLQQTPQYPDEYNSLPKYTPDKRRQSWYLVEFVLDRMITKPIMAGNKTSATFIHKGAMFQCNISVSWKLPESFLNYQFVAYSGPNNYSIASINNYVEICGISLCSKNSVSSCQQPPSFDDASKITFSSIEISTRSVFRDMIRIPIVSDSYLAAFDGTNFEFNSYDEDNFGQTCNRVDMKLTKPITNLMAFAVYKNDVESHPISKFTLYDFNLNGKTVS